MDFILTRLAENNVFYNPSHTGIFNLFRALAVLPTALCLAAVRVVEMLRLYRMTNPAGPSKVQASTQARMSFTFN